MKQNWQPDELTEHWSFTPEEKQQVLEKRPNLQLGFAVLFKFFQYQSRFPKSAREVPKAVVDILAEQLGTDPTCWNDYNWSGRTIKYHRAEIRKLLGFREATVADGEALVDWLGEHCLPDTRRIDRIESATYERFQALHIEPPTPERLSRLIRSAQHTFDQRLCANIYTRLSPETREQLKALLVGQGADSHDPQASTTSNRTPLQFLRKDTGPSTLNSLFREIGRLQQLRSFNLPPDLFTGISDKVL